MNEIKNEAIQALDKLCSIHKYFKQELMDDEQENIEIAIHNIEKCFPELCGRKEDE